MDIPPTNVKKSKTAPPDHLAANTQNITTQRSISRRVFGAGTEYAASLTNLTQSLFGKKLTDLSGVILSMLFHCDLQSLLILRLTSKGCCYLTSTINGSSSCSPLGNKTGIRFEYFQFSDAADKKLLADTTKSLIHVAIAVNDFPNKGKLPRLKTIEKDRLKLILNIENLDEIRWLHEEFFHLQNLPQESRRRSATSKIKELNFEKINIDINATTAINSLLTIIDQNMCFFPNLTNLTFGEVEQEGIFNLKEQPMLFSSIEKFGIKKLHKNVTYTISDKFCNLKRLKIGYIDKNVTLRLPDFLDQLREFTIESVCRKSFLGLTSSFNKLETLKLGVIGYSVSKKIPNNLYFKLAVAQTAQFGTFGKFSFLNNDDDHLQGGGALVLGNREVIRMDSLMPNLINLSIGNIKCGSTFNLLRPLSMLENLEIGDMGGSINLPDSLPNLRNLTINTISYGKDFVNNESINPKYQDIVVDLPCYTNVRNIYINKIFPGKYRLNGPFNIQSLTIGLMYSCTISLSPIFSNLQSLSIKMVEGDNVIKLPHSLNKLRKLDINGHYAIFREATIEGGLNIFIIQTVHDEVTAKLLSEINKKLNISEIFN